MRGPLFDDQMLCAASIARRLAIGRRRCVAGRGLEEIIMFVRQVKAHFKPEKFELFNKRFEKEVIPMLQKQKGFRDELSFFDKEKDEAISLSFWDTKEYADKYARDLYPTIHTKMEDMLKDTPQVRFFVGTNSRYANGRHAILPPVFFQFAFDQTGWFSPVNLAAAEVHVSAGQEHLDGDGHKDHAHEPLDRDETA
jgi:heme-degrading monooxygenase HmoA